MKKLLLIFFLFQLGVAHAEISNIDTIRRKTDSLVLEIARHDAAMYEQESKVEALKLSRTRWIFGITSLLLVISILLAISYLRRKKLESDQRALVLEQKLLLSQMNPHFIFNSLSSIQNFILYEDPLKASIYLSNFSQLVRNILENSREDFVTLENEVDTIRNYMELQQIRYEGKFDYTIAVDPDIDPDNTWIPPMLAQPFIENAIEHGIRNKTKPGHIDIRFRLMDNMVRFEVEDDGVGREKAGEIEYNEDHPHKPLATSITRERLETINKKLKTKIRLEITDLQDASGQPTGTLVSFGIPVIVK